MASEGIEVPGMMPAAEQARVEVPAWIEAQVMAGLAPVPRREASRWFLNQISEPIQRRSKNERQDLLPGPG